MAAQRNIHIGLSLGTLKSFKDGLGEFSRQLGEGLAGQAKKLREHHGIELHFNLSRPLIGAFGDEVHYHCNHDYQKFLHIGAKPYDLWHSFHQHDRILPPVRSRLRLVTVHDLNFFYFKSPGKIRRYVHRTRRLLQRYGQVAAISRYVEQDLRQQLGYAGGSRVIYNGARNMNGCPEAAASGLEERAYFLHLSRMVRSKNIEAILGLAKVWPEKLFVLAGSRNPESLQHQERARQEGLANVRFLMDIGEELKTWLYHHCEAFLFPSLTEGFGLPPIEAMHFGKPVFLSDRTCLPEIGGDWAFYWHDFEPKAMRLVVEAGLRRYREEDLGPGIQAHAARYSWEACTNDYLALYLSMLGIQEKERR